MNDKEPIDFSSLDPSLDEAQFEARLCAIVEQAEILRHQEEHGTELSALDPYATPAAFDLAIDRIVAQVRGSSDSKPADLIGPRLTRDLGQLGPKALSIAALFAAAVWGMVFWSGLDAVTSDTSAAPGLALSSWAHQGSVPDTEQIWLLVEESQGSSLTDGGQP